MAKTKTARQMKREEQRTRNRAQVRLDRLIASCDGEPKGRDKRLKGYLEEVVGS